MKLVLLILSFTIYFPHFTLLSAQTSENRNLDYKLSKEFFKTAVKENNLEAIKLFFEAGGLEKSFPDDSPLSIIVYEGSPQALDLLLQAKRLSKKDSYNSIQSLLINLNEEEKALVLMKYISDPNFIFAEGTGITLLHDASTKGMLKLSKALIGKGAKPELETITGQVPITNAVNSSAYEVYSYLRIETEFDKLSFRAVESLINSVLRNEKSGTLLKELLKDVTFPNNETTYLLLKDSVKQHRKFELLQLIEKYEASVASKEQSDFEVLCL